MLRLLRWSFALACALVRRSLWLAHAAALLLSLLLPHVTLALVVARIAVGHGAASGAIARIAADRLQCRATIDDSVVTFFGPTNAYGLRLYAEGESEPFLVAGRAETDLDLARAALRRPLYRLDLYDVDLRLRFDRNNKLLTVIKPKPATAPLPALRVRHARPT